MVRARRKDGRGQKAKQLLWKVTKGEEGPGLFGAFSCQRGRIAGESAYHERASHFCDGVIVLTNCEEGKRLCLIGCSNDEQGGHMSRPHMSMTIRSQTA